MYLCAVCVYVCIVHSVRVCACMWRSGSPYMQSNSDGPDGQDSKCEVCSP